MPTQPAVLGTARLGNFRLGYEPASLVTLRIAHVSILLAGVAAQVRIAGLTIHDLLNDAPNTATLTIDDATPPTVEQSLRITVNSDTPRLLFAGNLQTVGLSYEGLPAQRVWPSTAIDTTARANRRRPFGTYVSVSATTIAQALVSGYAPAFSTTNIAAGLPAVSIIFDGTEDWITALARLAKAIGGYCKVEDLDAYLFLTDTTDPPDAINDTPGLFLNDPPITMTRDVSQLRTRVYGKGHGEKTRADVAAGETKIPIADAVMFNPAGGKAIVGTTPDGAQSQIVDYTGTMIGGGGSLVGPGVQPSTAPTVALANGAGLGTGVYQYANTDVTASGETLPSPLASITTGTFTVAPPTTALFKSPQLGGGLVVGKWYGYRVTYTTAVGETESFNEINPGFTSASNNAFALSGIPISADPTVTGRKIYRSIGSISSAFAAAGPWALVATIADNTTTVITDNLADGSRGAALTNINTATGVKNQVAIPVLPLGPTGTTARKIYRTAVNGSQLKLQQTVSDNTTTSGVTDATADGSLGANAPTADTSLLPQPFGQVNAGTSALVTAGVGAFASGGGWVLVGSQVLRYTGISGNSLTGIPTSGAGAITTTIPYNSVVTQSPALIGVTGLTLAALNGTPVSIWVQRDDLAAQATQAAVDAANGVTPADGIYEGPVIVDERRGEASLTALCDANLQLFSTPIVTVTYATRDVKTKSGKTVHVATTTPPIGPVDLVIQDVTITELGTAPGTAPKFTVTASSTRFSLDDLLRKLLAASA